MFPRSRPIHSDVDRARRRTMCVVAVSSMVLWVSIIARAQDTPPEPIPPADMLPIIVSTAPTPQHKTDAARIDTTLLTMAEEHRRFMARARGLGERFRSAVSAARVSNDEYVLIDSVASSSSAALLQRLKTLGLRQSSQRGRIVSGWLPVAALKLLPQLSELRHARPVYFTTNAGRVTSQGDGALGASTARAAHGVDGTGVVIGTLSDSYNCLGTASSDVANGDLPSGVIVIKDIAAASCGGYTDEGRAMMQIEHDLAPGAQLAFYTASNGSADFANGIAMLGQNAGARVIVDDVLYFAEPMFQDGIIAQAVDTVVQQGASYFSAAGNYAAQSYESPFRGSGVYGPYGQRHNFDPGGGSVDRQSVTIPAGQTVYIVLQWNQPFFSVSGGSGATTDLDLVLYNAATNAMVAHAATNNIGGDAVEILGYTNPATQTNTSFKLAIERASGPAPSLMKYVWLGSMTVQQFGTASSTLYGHANAAGARALGASYFRNTPVYGISPATLESYSSLGGTTILFDKNGTSHTASRLKPEFVAVDGVDTSFFGTDVDGNGFPNFFGTSAAAPHAAAIAALLLQASWSSTPAQIYQSMIETTTDMGAAGFDFQTGAGLLQAAPALDWIARAQDSGEIGFGSTPDGSPTLGSIAVNAYASQGLTLQVSNRSDGYATLSPPPTGGGAAGGFFDSSLQASGTPGTTSITLQFSPAVSQITFAFATASGQIHVDMQDSSGHSLQTVDPMSSTTITFPNTTLKGGTISLPAVGAVSRVVISTVGTDTDLRIDGLNFIAYSTAVSATDADAPLPSWAAIVFAILLLGIGQRVENRWRGAPVITTLPY